MDPVSKTVSFLKDNWDSSNTGGETPRIDPIYDMKRISGLTADNDVIAVYTVSETNQPRGVGFTSLYKGYRVTIDMRATKCSHDHIIDIKDEVERIITNKRSASDIDDDDYLYLVPHDVDDKSDRKKQLYWKTMDVEYHGVDYL